MVTTDAYPVAAEAPWEAKAREAAELAARAQKLLLEAEEAKAAAMAEQGEQGDTASSKRKKRASRISFSRDVDAAQQAKSAQVETETMKTWSMHYGAAEVDVLPGSDEDRSASAVLLQKFGVDVEHLSDEIVLKPQVPLGVEGARGLAQLLAAGMLHRLEVLTLPFSALGDEGTVALADALTAELPLQQLDMSGNSIRDPGTDAIARALNRGAAPHLMKLNLKNNDLNDEAAVALAGASHSTLEWLNLSSNQIADGGGIALASALTTRRFGSLRRLSLDHNRLGDEAMGALAAALEAPEGNGLEELYVECNLASDVATWRVQRHFDATAGEEAQIVKPRDARAACEELSVSIYRSGCVLQ